MEYQVPQFIEVEDKIFGPFTLKQFIYLAGGIGFSVAIFLYVHPLFLAIIIIAPIAALSGALAFYRVNNKPFIDILEAAISFYRKGRLYLWKKEDAPEEATVAVPEPALEVRQKLQLTQSKLHDLAWSLDIKDPGQGTQP